MACLKLVLSRIHKFNMFNELLITGLIFLMSVVQKFKFEMKKHCLSKNLNLENRNTVYCNKLQNKSNSTLTILQTSK